ncbi:discoidin domain-containing protein [Brevibacillus brevis]|uniref:discoidin domain-containing protein n=1 Tax=Brevibacillus brevis TaxID=1393 RepID=UPI001C8E8590|nr:discoidin domain-containing protein [Brevibacillus brevis]MBY0083845.1 discoidin domain-containing protein [Brevibacillus brevis]UKK96576.1 carbohydrate-binding protein [Brevibacillus brevis]
MSVRITRTGTEVVLDHNQLANKGKRTHAEIDSYLQELDDARENKPSLQDKFRELKDKDDEQDRQLDAVKGAVSTFQTGLNTLSSTVGAVEAKNQTQDLRLSQVEQKNAQQDQAILKLQSDVSSNPNAEVVAARRDRDGRTFPSLKARLDDMQGRIGSGGGGGNNGGASSSSFDLQTPINILLNTFRDAETHNRPAYRQNNMYVDVFSDSSGIDTEKSSSFAIINGTVSPGLYDTNIIMSSPTEPTPYHVTSSSETSVYPGWMGINGNVTDYYYSNGATPPAEGHWWQIDFFVPKIITKLAIKPLRISSGQYSIASFTLQGSNDDTNWTDIYAGSPVNTDSETEHNFTNTSAYRYYRLAKLRSYLRAYPVIYTGWHEIKFYEAIDAVTLVTKAVNVGRSPKKIITTAEYTDAVTFDLTLDGTTWVNNIDLNKLIDTSSLKGTNLQLRANIPSTGSLKSLGFTWYDDSMLVEMPSKEGGGGDRSSTKPLVDVVAATNILRNAYRTLEKENQGASIRHNLYADCFKDTSGIDESKSESFQITNGTVIKSAGAIYSWQTLGVQTASSVGDYNNNNSSYRPFKANSTTVNYSVEKIADDNAIATSGGYTDCWLQSGTSADLFMKWVTPVEIYKIILWMNGSSGQSGHDYCDHQIFVKNPSTGQWEAVTPRINLASNNDTGVHGDGSWHYPVNLGYLINEVKVTVWNKSTYMTVTEIQILQTSDKNPVMVSKPIPLAKAPTHLVLDAEYEGNIRIDLSLDGGTTFTAGVPLNQLVDLNTFLPGNSLVIRANLSDKAVLNSIGCIWYDKDTLPTYTDTVGGSSGGNVPGNGVSMIQVEKYGVTASPISPSEVNITIPYTTDYKIPPIEVLKFAPGEHNYSLGIASFSSNEAPNFDHDNYMELDGTLRLKTEYSIELTEDVVLPSGNSVYSLTLDMNQYSSIEKIKVN